MNKTLTKISTEGLYLKMTKSIYDQATANIILSGGELKVFPLKLGTGQVCPLWPLLSNIVLETSTREIRQKKAVKCVCLGKEEVKVVLFEDDVILYTEDSKSLSDS